MGGAEHPLTQELFPLSVARTLCGHSGPVYSLKFTRDGTYMLSGGHDTAVCLWNPLNGMLIKKYSSVLNYEVLGIDIAQDKAHFFSAGGDKHAVCVDVTTGQIVRKFTGHERKINALSLLRGTTHPRSVVDAGLSAHTTEQILVTASSDRSVRFWDLRTGGGRIGCGGRGSAVQVLQDATDSVMTLSISCNSVEILTGSMDGCLRRYDIRNGQVSVDSLQDPVSRASFSGDGNCILCSTLASKIYLLDKGSGDLLQVYRGHTCSKFVIDCVLDPSDAYVLSGSEDGNLVAWELVEGTIETQCVVDDFRTTDLVLLSLVFRDEEMMVCGGNNGQILVFQRSGKPAVMRS